MATCGKFTEPTWDSENKFKFGVGATSSDVYSNYLWLVDNFFMSAAVEYLQAQFARGYTPKPLFNK